MCHFRKRATYVPAEFGGGLDNISRNRAYPGVPLQVQNWHIRRSVKFGGLWIRHFHLTRAPDYFVPGGKNAREGQGSEGPTQKLDAIGSRSDEVGGYVRPSEGTSSLTS